MNIKRSLAAALLTLAATATIAAQDSKATVELQGETFTVDTVYHYKCGPGMTRTSLVYLSTTGSTRIHSYVIKTMLADAKNVEFKVELGQDSCLVAETVTSMGRRHSVEGERYLTGVNGDFFITSSFGGPYSQYGIVGYPNMSSASSGKLMSPDVIDWVSRENAFILDDKGYMRIDATDLSYSAVIGGENVPISQANFHRFDGDLVIYNSYIGGYTKTAAGGCEVAFRLADGEIWGINKDIKVVVTQEAYEGGNMAVPADGIVLSADANATDAIAKLKSLKIGDEITVNYSLSLPSYGNLKPEGVQEIIGGDVKILRDGETVMEANRWINPRDSFNPRTLIGYDKDRTMIIICAIDGRGVSSGTTYPQGADLMRSYGCYDALDFDGGGSTLMWGEMEGTINTPCVSPERAVGNGIFAVLHAPDDDAISEIRFADYALRVPQYMSYHPVFYGYNQYGRLIDMDVQGVTISCDDALGEITDEGTVLYTKGSGTHALTATYGDISASIPVTIADPEDIVVKYPSVLLDNYRTWKIDVDAIVGGKEMPIEPRALTWTSSDESVLTVNEEGLVNGLKNGSATLTGTLGDIVRTIDVTVECPQKELIPIGIESIPEAWTMTRSNVKSDASLTMANGGGLSINFTLSSSRGPALTLKPVEPLYLFSLPDELRLKLTLNGDVSVSNTVISFTFADGKRVNATLDAVDSNGVKDYVIDFSALVDTTNIGIYPIKISSVRFGFSGKAGASSHLEIPSFTVHYKNYDEAGIEAVIADDDTSVAPIYYNLQGIRVTKPRIGEIYIVRLPHKASKVLITE